MSEIKIRFNTKYLEGDPELTWRLLIDGEEFLASHIEVKVPSWTSVDILKNGETKWHLSCVGNVEWSGSRALIKEYR